MWEFRLNRVHTVPPSLTGRNPKAEHGGMHLRERSAEAMQVGLIGGVAQIRRDLEGRSEKDAPTSEVRFCFPEKDASSQKGTGNFESR